MTEMVSDSVVSFGVLKDGRSAAAGQQTIIQQAIY